MVLMTLGAFDVFIWFAVLPRHNPQSPPHRQTQKRAKAMQRGCIHEVRTHNLLQLNTPFHPSMTKEKTRRDRKTPLDSLSPRREYAWPL